jgi:ABC-type dipeptide/oligopeptide/nickel transport system permease component
MFKYLETTFLILVWCSVLSGLWAVFCYQLTIKRKVRHALGSEDLTTREVNVAVGSRVAIIPALVLAPLIVAAAYKIFGLNLLFPVHFFASFSSLCAAAFVPAVVLVLASGLFGTMKRMINYEYDYWQSKTFALVTASLGLSVSRSLGRLVIWKSLATAWSRCLPWLFGELIVVEAVFNAPGLGLFSWHMARTQDFGGLAGAIMWLALLYGLCVAGSAMINGWIGKRLESYV